MFSGCTVLPDIKETKLGSSDQKASPWGVISTRVILVPCHTLKCAPTAISGGVDISEVPRCYLLQQMKSQWESQKLLKGWCLMNSLSVFDLLLTRWIMVILWKGCKPNNFKSHNSLKLRFMNIEGLIWDLFLENFADSYVFDWLYFTQCLNSFSSVNHFWSLWTVFYSISSNIDEVFSINTSANSFRPS